MDENEKKEIEARCQRLNGQFALLRMLEDGSRIWAVSCLNVLVEICLQGEDPKLCFEAMTNGLKQHFENCQSKEASE